MKTIDSNETLPSRLFWSACIICSFWIFFVNDYSNVEIQSPIKFGGVGVSAVRSSVESPDPVESSPELVSDAAPVVDLPPADAKAYIKKYAGVAVEEMRRTGIPASVSMAQALVESRAGTSGLALTANNHFGMKCHIKGKCQAGHCVNFTDDTDVDYFLVFQNQYKSWKAHSELLKKPRYKKCFAQKSYQGWAKELKSAGYATAPNYAKSLITIIEKYKLHLLDKK